MCCSIDCTSTNIKLAESCIGSKCSQIIIQEFLYYPVYGLQEILGYRKGYGFVLNLTLTETSNKVCKLIT